MDHIRLGDSGLQVSRLILGCMSFGDPARGTHAWSVGIDEARPLVRQAWEAGITTFDTANIYSFGTSEEIMGTLLAELAPRDEYVLATKVHGRMHPGPKGGGLSRAAIMTQLDASLRRLGTDHVDLYQIHRYDHEVPIEETMQALHDCVQAGKVRYLGASSMAAWEFVQAQYVADLGGWTRFVAMQDHYNLLMREEEREMHPFCLDQGVGVIPWSPLARGRLTRPWGEQTSRSERDGFGSSLYRQSEAADREVVSAVAAVARARGVPMAQVALAWMLHKPAVTAPIVGVTRAQHLVDAVAAVALALNDDEVARLEAAYVPHAPVGY